MSEIDTVEVNFPYWCHSEEHMLTGMLLKATVPRSTTVKIGGDEISLANCLLEMQAPCFLGEHPDPVYSTNSPASEPGFKPDSRLRGSQSALEKWLNGCQPVQVTTRNPNIESFYALRLKAYPSTLPNLSSQPGAARDARELRMSATVEYFKHCLDPPDQADFLDPPDLRPEHIRKDLECSVMVVRFSTASNTQQDVAPDSIPGDSSPSQANDPDHVAPITLDCTVDMHLK